MNGAPAFGLAGLEVVPGPPACGSDLDYTFLWFGWVEVSGGPVGVEEYGAGGAGCVVCGAGPRVDFGPGDEAAGDRVAVNVSELL